MAAGKSVAIGAGARGVVSAVPQERVLPDGRLHLQHGPIDLLIRAWGAEAQVLRAYQAACESFRAVLAILVSELPTLRAPLAAAMPRVAGPVARRMVPACWPYRDEFITPMAAVAGSVADHVLAAMLDVATLDRAFVNDGGDIAFHVTRGHDLVCGLAPDLAVPCLAGTMRFAAGLDVRGLATSGRACKGSGGRSFSFGIADAVTVLARDAAAADAAATIVANAVDLPGHAAVTRVSAASIDPDSDLGERLITWDVGALTPAEIATALAPGLARAEMLRRAGLIWGAVLVLRGHTMVTGEDAMRLAA
jgi:uncharacterized protein